MTLNRLTSQTQIASGECRFQSRWARIISGADEGVYGWIALNYMTGHLASNPILAADQGLEGTADEPIAVTSARCAALMNPALGVKAQGAPRCLDASPDVVAHKPTSEHVSMPSAGQLHLARRPCCMLQRTSTTAVHDCSPSPVRSPKTCKPESQHP